MLNSSFLEKRNGLLDASNEFESEDRSTLLELLQALPTDTLQDFYSNNITNNDNEKIRTLILLKLLIAEKKQIAAKIEIKTDTNSEPSKFNNSYNARFLNSNQNYFNINLQSYIYQGPAPALAPTYTAPSASRR